MGDRDLWLAFAFSFVAIAVVGFLFLVYQIWKARQTFEEWRRIRRIVCESLDNTVINGYPVSDDDFREAQELKDQVKELEQVPIDDVISGILLWRRTR